MKLCERCKLPIAFRGHLWDCEHATPLQDVEDMAGPNWRNKVFMGPKLRKIVEEATR